MTQRREHVSEESDFILEVEDTLGISIDKKKRNSDWQKKHCRYFQIAGITACLESEIELNEVKISDQIMAFKVDGPGDDNVKLQHYFRIPSVSGIDLGKEIYHKTPWLIYNKNGIWCYRGISKVHKDNKLHKLAFFSSDYSQGIFFSHPIFKEYILAQGWQTLSCLPTDQIWLIPLLADRNAILIHSAAAIINGHGLLFVGHSDAGKSTTMEFLMAKDNSNRSESGLKNEESSRVEILCDDRNIVRKWPDGWRVHGTWSHGDVTHVSPSSAPLRAVLFLEQAEENEIAYLADRKLIWHKLLATLVRAAVTADWWNKELNILEQLVAEVEFYRMRFDKTGAIIPALEKLTT